MGESFPHVPAINFKGGIMPNYCLSCQLDFAVSLFKQRFAKVAATEKDTLARKWARMSLESSQKKGIKSNGK